jgi:hypothetical protein
VPEAGRVNAQLHAALELAARGWRVFPVPAGTKDPSPWRWGKWNTTDPARIRQWWQKPANIGITCGPSGLVVVDCDIDTTPLPPPWDAVPGVRDGVGVFAVLLEGHSERWPDTYTVRTPRGGLHFYYQAGGHGIRNSASQVGPQIDVRADGGFVVAAGSARPDGAYELVDDRDPAPLPGWLAALAARAKPETAHRAAAGSGSSPAYVRAALEDEIRAVAAAARGKRNDQLNKSAFALARFVRSGDLTPDTFTAALAGAAARCGLDAAETRRTIASALKGRTA